MGTVDRLKEKLEHKDCIGKPCPICGAAPTIKSRGFDPWGDMGYDCCTEYWVECSGCGIIKAGSYDNIHDKDIEAKDKATKDWNEVVDYVNELIANKQAKEKNE